jgi:5-methylcytosine-specific restriction endonuclease McrA
MGEMSDIPMKKCSTCGEEKPATPEYFHRLKKGIYGVRAVCKVCIAKYQQAWHQANLERKNERVRKHYITNREYILERKRQWRLVNHESVRATAHRRMARKRGLPDNFTKRDHRFMMEYWHGCCAVCGHQLRDLFGNVIPNNDHWIPLADQRPDNPGTVPTNILPLCRDCNLSKTNKDPIEWLFKKYPRTKAAEILAKIEAYFQHLRNNPQ